VLDLRRADEQEQDAADDFQYTVGGLEQQPNLERQIQPWRECGRLDLTRGCWDGVGRCRVSVLCVNGCIGAAAVRATARLYNAAIGNAATCGACGPHLVMV
jgi:hypothetical protein